MKTTIQKRTTETRRPQRKTNKISVPPVSPWLICLLSALLVLAAGVAVYAQAGGGYDLTWNTVDGGGVTFASGGGYTLGGTAGQPDAATWGGASAPLSMGYTLSGGFWHAGAGGGTPPGGETTVYLPLIVKP